MGLIPGVSALAFLLSLILTPLCRNASRRRGLLDRPDYFRKIHKHPVSCMGGVAIFLALAGSLGVLAALQTLSGSRGSAWEDVSKLAPAVLLALLTGLIDDVRGLRPWQKFAGLTFAAGLACLAGVQIYAVAGHAIRSSWLHTPLTILWLVGCANAFNLIDGVDGLAAGVGLFATLATLAAAWLGGDSALVLATAPLAGALMGFLRYNFNPATIFLGDCGSLSIGFALGCYGIFWSQHAATLRGFAAPIIVLSVPLLETMLSIARRFLRGKPIFAADRRHIHHRLLDLGLQPRAVALVMYGISVAAGVCALLVSVAGVRVGGMLVITFCLAVWLGIRRLDYSEFAAALQLMFGGLMARMIDTEVSLRQLDAQLAAASYPEQRRGILAATSGKLGFNEILIASGGATWRQVLGSAPPSECWQLRVPLTGENFAEFSIALNTRLRPVMLWAFANLVRRHMTPPPVSLPRRLRGGVVFSPIDYREHTVAEKVSGD